MRRKGFKLIVVAITTILVVSQAAAAKKPAAKAPPKMTDTHFLVMTSVEIKAPAGKVFANCADLQKLVGYAEAKAANFQGQGLGATCDITEAGGQPASGQITIIDYQPSQRLSGITIAPAEQAIWTFILSPAPNNATKVLLYEEFHAPVSSPADREQTNRGSKEHLLSVLNNLKAESEK